jgi:VIT1/CCC1 family predicted Fe2+/Mn2+ transporter
VRKVTSIHEKASLLRDTVFGANDGIITTFAIVAGSAGASLPARVVLILGFANLFADGLSMATGNYLGIKSEMEYQEAENSKGEVHSPLKHGTVTFVSFFFAGLLPLLPYLGCCGDKFLMSSLVVVVTLFGIGSLRSRFTHKDWFISGLEMLAIGGFAALVAYFVGHLLDRFLI